MTDAWRWMGVAFGACCALASSCARSLPAPVLARHPPIRLELPRAVVVETSTASMPGWVKRPDPRSDGRVVFVGRGAARALQDARDNARRDLLAALARYVSVKAESSFDSKSSHVSSDGKVEEHEEVHAEEGARADVTLESFREVMLAGEYWEKVSEPGDAGWNYRCFLRAIVPVELIARAQVERQILRARRRGAKILAIASFEDSGEGGGEELRGELTRRLAAEPRLFIAEGAMLSGGDHGGPLVPDSGSRLGKAEPPVDASRSRPDLLVRGRILRGPHSAEVLEYELVDAITGDALQKRRVGGSAPGRFDAEERLIEALQLDLQEVLRRSAPASGLEEVLR